MKKRILLCFIMVSFVESSAQWVTTNTTNASTSNVYINAGKVGIGYTGTTKLTLNGQLQFNIITTGDNTQIILNGGSTATPAIKLFKTKTSLSPMGYRQSN